MTSTSPASSSPAPFDFEPTMSSPGAATSTAASSPPPNVLSEYSCASSEVADTDFDVPEASASIDVEPEVEDTETQRRLARLQFVLNKSAVYSSILKERMDEDKARQLAAHQAQRQQAGHKRGRGAAGGRDHGKKKKGLDGEAIPVDAEGHGDDEPAVFSQPSLITGAKLKSYQLEGLQWMVSLDQNGISGILADEMGLGKTLQTIAFSAYLREHHNSKPFLVVCPLSVLHNWVDEYAKFAPDIPVCMYHGTPAERAQLRKTVMALPGSKPFPGSKPSEQKRGKAPAKNTKKPAKASPRRSGRPRKSIIIIDSDEEEEEEEVMEVDPQSRKNDEDVEDPFASFPIVLTTYEIIIKDRKHLAHYNWSYIVVDEGHRLKNLNCKLMKEIKQYKSAGRMILTGTPLHNNLAELWSLLNFILPDIFDDIDSFQEWFNLPELQSALPTNQSSQIISSLHAILKPFLLRRLKVDVETNLPPKKEYILYAPLSMRQREAYDRVLSGGLRRWLIHGGTGGAEVSKEEDPVEVEEEQEDNTQGSKEEAGKWTSKRRKTGRKIYVIDGDDDEYFDMLEKGEIDQWGVKKQKVSKEEEEAEEARIGREHQHRTKVLKVNNMKLQNAVMQLRKVCSHPFLFDWPVDPATMMPILGEELVNASGKMMVLDRLLRELFRRKHKVLLFSQFTTMLNIIEDWATDYMGWNVCRIDGDSKPMERREAMNLFQNGGDDPEAPSLFLLSTRAGGLGINLVAADTVIFYDQDWNPQMDAQAQDRAHRIGQTKPVLIFRLVSAHTIETKIMQRATEKRKLEALVIAKGKFKMPAAAASTKRETIAEMAASLLKLEGEKIEVVPNTKEGKRGVLSDEDLDILLDRSPEVFAERVEGWSSRSAGKKEVQHVDEGKKAAFAVYEAPVEEGNDALAKMMGEDVGDL
ncbi:hypothetical protein K443DRAFT_681497 [Laccaria amethystina LaAM-08-1]|uniref:Chromatin-remodeling ATPase INO80 n=1 Tax=Laccaria amethystina LaAM-08-1 TaxID=1095629 RepID=A0A0C9X814_9AGAR|nr:hypothetical protein K443DRAFT_681497 [Laccaria amethystina LaAM-08-1]